MILEYFEINYKPEKINISLNKRWNSISEYNEYGFKLVEETEPNKFYFKVNENELFLDSGENEEDLLRNNYRIIAFFLVCSRYMFENHFVKLRQK